MAFTETKKKKNHCFSSLSYFSGIFHHSLSKLTVVPSNACGFTVGSRWLVQDTRNTSCNTKKTGASLFQDLHTYLPNVRFPVIFPSCSFPTNPFPLLSCSQFLLARSSLGPTNAWGLGLCARTVTLWEGGESEGGKERENSGWGCSPCGKLLEDSS